MLLLAAVVALSARGAETSVSAVRQVLHAKLVESLPPFPAAKPPETLVFPAIFARPPANLESGYGNKPERVSTEEAPLVMSPFIVSEHWRDRALRADIARQTQPETFSPVSGGTLYTKDLGRVRMDVGGWWSPRQGWSFLRFSW